MLVDLLTFVVIAVFIFILSPLVLLLMIRTPPMEIADQDREVSNSDERSDAEMLGDLAEEISGDEELLAAVTPLQVPHLDLPGALLGGGAKEEACSKVSGSIVLDRIEDPNEKREYNRRMRDRRSTDDSPAEEEQRMVQRRVWLRREEDQRGKQLLNVTDAADTLGVTIEQIYKWLDKADIPFYQVTEGKRKAIRFDVNELLKWHSSFKGI